MTAAASLAGAWLLIVAAGLYWTARLVHTGNLDAHDLAEKNANHLTFVLPRMSHDALMDGLV